MFTSLSEWFRRRFERNTTRNLRPYPACYRSRFCNTCRPLRGLTSTAPRAIPGLTPGATLCRRLRRLVELLTRTRLRSKRTAFSILSFSFFLFPFSFVYSQGNDLDYSKFLHASQRHASVACSSCHHRPDNSATPGFPGHKDCTGCHLTQFTTPTLPICAICHVNANGNHP